MKTSVAIKYLNRSNLQSEQDSSFLSKELR